MLFMSRQGLIATYSILGGIGKREIVRARLESESSSAGAGTIGVSGRSEQGFQIAARVLATYLIPGCVGRGVKLGSENSSGAGAGGAGAGAGGAWAQAWAQVGGPTWGPSGWAQAKILGPKKSKK